MTTLDLVIYLAGIAAIGTFAFILWSYGKNLKHSPRELYILYIAKIVEYVAYGAMNLSFVLYLSADLGMSDVAAGSYIGVFSTGLTLITMFVGSFADAVGIKKTLLIGTGFLLLSRFILPISHNATAVTLLGFAPMAFGMAMMGPVLSIGIKKYTTKETAAMGFALFYTLMNVGWAGGAWLFDFVRGKMGEHGSVTLLSGMLTVSSYQMIFLAGLFLTLVNLVILLFMRDGVEIRENKVHIEPQQVRTQKLGVSGSLALIKNAMLDSVRILKTVIVEKPFWIFLFMLGTLVFVRLTFYHFHYTFPKYGIRTLGEGLKIGAIFGVLNPVMIVFLTPLVAALTRKVSSYILLLIGTLISSLAVYVAILPANLFESLMGTWFSELVFDRWLAIPAAQQQPIILALVIMVAIFTVGEAIWSPRLMHFTAEIAPKGREGSYIALSYLPFFGAKLVSGPLSGWLLATYVPAGAASYPSHYMVWIWIGTMALFSPICLVLFRSLFFKAENQKMAEAKAALNQEAADGAS